MKALTKANYRYRLQPNGYQETIEKGLSAIHYFNRRMSLGKGNDMEQLDRLKKK